ncbi:MAG: hypothetical protein ABIH82_05640 [Candidatus Woesearchaeota archaeon]
MEGHFNTRIGVFVQDYFEGRAYTFYFGSKFQNISIKFYEKGVRLNLDEQILTNPEEYFEKILKAPECYESLNLCLADLNKERTNNLIKFLACFFRGCNTNIFEFTK